MLSPEERESLLDEASSSRRREVLGSARRAGYGALGLTAYLDFLSSANQLLGPLVSLPRRKPLPGGRYLL